MARTDTPAGAHEHTPECARRLPYSDPLHRDLDTEDCARCRWLWMLLNEAAERRAAAMQAVKAFIVSELDKLPHGARGYTATELHSQLAALQNISQVAPSLSYASRDQVNSSLRHLLEDKIINDCYIQGRRLYHTRGR